MEDTVEINGHTVPAQQADSFRDGNTGRGLTDSEWDETERRNQLDWSHLVPPEHLS